MYTHTTYSTAKSLLAARLGDPEKIFWTDTELGYAIIEAKRIWNSVTLHDRAKGYFTTTAGTVFYQLASVLEDTDSALLRAQTIRDRQLVSEIEYHLIEPQNLTGWSGTDQFTFNQILTALQRRRDQFLADTACVLSTRTDAVTVDSLGVITMPDSVIGIRRSVFSDQSGRYTTLRKSDERMANARSRYWTADASTPATYSVSAEPNLNVRLLPLPANDGTLESVVVTTGATLDTTANSGAGTLLGVPDDLAWGVKYGALADLYNDQTSIDPALAEACESMYKLAVQLAVRMPVVLTAQISGVNVLPASLSETDMARNGWQGLARGIPSGLSVVGPDLVAVSRTPDSVYSIALEVVRTATVPSAAGDFVDVGREHLDALLGMAQRICLLKVGSPEYDSAEPMALKFFAQASEYSFRRSAASTALQVLLGATIRESAINPYKTVPRVVSDRDDEVKSERNARRRPFRRPA